MTDYTAYFYGVQLSNGKVVDEVAEHISEQEYNNLINEDWDIFYSTYSAIRKRVEEHLGLVIRCVVDWDATAEHK